MKKIIVCTAEAQKIFETYKNANEQPRMVTETTVEIRGKLKGVEYTCDKAIIAYTRPYYRVPQYLEVDKQELIYVCEVV